MGEQDPASPVPLREAGVLGLGELSRVWGFLRAQKWVGGGLRRTAGRPRVGGVLGESKLTSVSSGYSRALRLPGTEGSSEDEGGGGEMKRLK